jgi:crotonobetainyl-CoA:carnitine CoA-transferase CaiB-like acyl-CoA transferase
MSGLMSITGADENSPTRVGVAIGDLVAGMWGAIGVQAAVALRHHTGEGQIVETSLLGGLVGLLSVQGQRFLSLGQIPVPVGNDHPVISPCSAFIAKDGALNVTVATQKMWASLCACIVRPELLDDPRFVDNEARVRNRQILTSILNEVFSQASREEWTHRLIAAGIPAGPIYNVGEALNSEQVLANGLVESVLHPELGEIRLVGSPIRMESMGNRTVRLPPPLLGEHTTQILTMYGFDAAEIETLRSEEVIYQHALQCGLAISNDDR